MYDKVITKFSAIDTSRFVLETQYNTDKLECKKEIDDADKEIPDTSGIVNKNRL